MKKKLLLLVNPYAGQQRIRSELVYVIDELTRADYEIVTATTQGSLKTGQLLKDYDSQFEKVVCCGGDGTFNAVLEGTLSWKKKPVLGYIPAGTTNDFAAGIQLPTDITEAVDTIINGSERQFDAGLFNDRHFSYIASFGAFTETSYSTPQTIKNDLGHLAYILEGIKEIPLITTYHITLRTGDETYQGEFVFGAVSNAKSIGGIVKMDDSAVDLSDGLLEVVMVRMPKSLQDLGKIITSLNTRVFDNDMFLFLQTDSLSIHTEQALVWSLDGERAEGGTDVVIRCLPRAFSIMTRKEVS